MHLEMNGFFQSNIIYLLHFRFLYLANVVLNVQKLLKKTPQNKHFICAHLMLLKYNHKKLFQVVQ